MTVYSTQQTSSSPYYQLYVSDEIFSHIISFVDSPEYITLQRVSHRTHEISQNIIPLHLAIHGLLSGELTVKHWRNLHVIQKYDTNVLVAAAFKFKNIEKSDEEIDEITRRLESIRVDEANQEKEDEASFSPMRALKLLQEIDSSTFDPATLTSKDINGCLKYQVLLQALAVWARHVKWDDARKIPQPIRVHEVFLNKFLLTKQEGKYIGLFHPIFPGMIDMISILKRSFKLIITLAHIRPNILEYLDQEMKENDHLFKTLIEKNGDCIKYSALSIQKNLDMARLALQNDRSCFMSLLPEIQEMEEFALLFIEGNEHLDSTKSQLPSHYFTDREFVKKAVQVNGSFYPHLQKPLRLDREIIELSLTGDDLENRAKLIPYIPQEIINDTTFIYRLAEKNPYIANHLEYLQLGSFR